MSANWTANLIENEAAWASNVYSTSAVAPSITTAALPNGTLDTPYSQQVQVSGTGPFTYMLLSGELPLGLEFSAQGVVLGVPTEPTKAVFTIQVTGPGGSATKELSIVVPNEGAGFDAQAVTTLTLVPAEIELLSGDTVDLLLTVEDQDGEPVSSVTGEVVLTAEGVVTVELFGPTDLFGQATIPLTGVAPGSCDLQVKIDGVSSNVGSVMVLGAFPPTIQTTSLPDAVVGQAYSAVLNATGSEPITWSIVSGSIAPLTLSGNVLAGTPTVAGPMTFTARADNSVGFAQQAFTITVLEVAPPNQAPTNIVLSASSVLEGAANGTVIGAFTTADPDQATGHTYTLVDDAGGRFAIQGDQLVVADGSRLNYDVATQHTIAVRTTDSGGLTFEKTFVISILDVVLSSAVVRVQLFSRAGALRSAVSGIAFMWWDTETPTGPPTMEGTASTDANGWVQINLIGSSLGAGEVGHLKLFKLGATADLDLHFSGRLPVVMVTT